MNAYTGAVHLYQWGNRRPRACHLEERVPRPYPASQNIPPALMPHLRYPEVLFEAQRQIIAQYHVTAAAGVLRRPGLLVRAHRPERPHAEAIQPAAVLHDDGHAGLLGSRSSR